MKSGYQVKRYRPRMIAAHARRARLAEHVAEEGSLSDFALSEGISANGARKVWRAIVAEVGSQAQ